MINGTYSILSIKLGGIFLPVGLMTSNSFSESVEMLDTTTRDNAGWRTETPTNQSYSISFDGLVKQTLYVGQPEVKLTFQDLKTLKRDRTLIEWKIDSSVDIYGSSGFAYISSLENSASIDEFITFSASLNGYGLITETTKELTLLQSELQIEL